MADAKASGGLHVNLITPRGYVSQDETNAVIGPGELGEFEILPGHVPFLTALHPGVLTLGEGPESSVYAVSRGYLRVDREGHVEILCEQAVAAGKIDVPEAKIARRAAEKDLEARASKPQDGDWQSARDNLDWAQAQLDAHARVA